MDYYLLVDGLKFLSTQEVCDALPPGTVQDPSSAYYNLTILNLPLYIEGKGMVAGLQYPDNDTCLLRRLLREACLQER